MSSSSVTIRRTDNGQATEHQLPVDGTTTVLGRGPFLKCNERKISRQHASISCSSSASGAVVSLTSTHVNPCFYRRKNSKPAAALEKLDNGQSVELTNGDEFRLVEDAFCYRVILRGGSKGAGSNDDAAVTGNKKTTGSPAAKTNADSKASSAGKGATPFKASPSTESDNCRRSPRKSALSSTLVEEESLPKKVFSPSAKNSAKKAKTNSQSENGNGASAKADIAADQSTANDETVIAESSSPTRSKRSITLNTSNKITPNDVSAIAEESPTKTATSPVRSTLLTLNNCNNDDDLPPLPRPFHADTPLSPVKDRSRPSFATDAIRMAFSGDGDSSEESSQGSSARGRRAAKRKPSPEVSSGKAPKEETTSSSARGRRAARKQSPEISPVKAAVDDVDSNPSPSRGRRAAAVKPPSPETSPSKVAPDSSRLGRNRRSELNKSVTEALEDSREAKTTPPAKESPVASLSTARGKGPQRSTSPIVTATAITQPPRPPSPDLSSDGPPVKRRKLPDWMLNLKQTTERKTSTATAKGKQPLKGPVVRKGVTTGTPNNRDAKVATEHVSNVSNENKNANVPRPQKTNDNKVPSSTGKRVTPTANDSRTTSEADEDNVQASDDNDVVQGEDAPPPEQGQRKKSKRKIIDEDDVAVGNDENADDKPASNPASAAGSSRQGADDVEIPRAKDKRNNSTETRAPKPLNGDDDDVEIPRAKKHDRDDVAHASKQSNGDDDASQSAAGGSRHHRTYDDEDDDGNETQSASAAGANQAAGSDRMACRFGDKCYRKNPKHREEFSHPGDDDYECPFGADCYRKNPMHRKQYFHPTKPKRKAAVQGQAEREKKKKKKKDDGDGGATSSEDDYDLNDSFLNDASSDDYQPTDSGASDTDEEPLSDSERQARKKKQKAADEADEEERRRLLKEAKKFTAS